MLLLAPGMFSLLLWISILFKDQLKNNKQINKTQKKKENKREEKKRGSSIVISSLGIFPVSLDRVHCNLISHPTELYKCSHQNFFYVVACPTLWDPMDYTVHGFLQARTLKWVAFPFSRGSSQPRDQTQVSHIVDGFFINWATREA